MTTATQVNPSSGRLLSLDILRGLIVFGMIFVNISAHLYYSTDVKVSELLLHASWEGFKIPDVVFPAFIFIVGMSIALSLSKQKASGEPDGNTIKRIGVRSLKLILLGLLVSNMFAFFDGFTLSSMRYPGVLQRIGIAYFVTAILFLKFSWRVLAVIAVAILALYWPVVMLSYPDAAVDLTARGANFVSWVDRALIDGHTYVKEPLAYDPEGIVSTLPTIAHCILGVLFGLWVKGQERTMATVMKIAAIGAAATIVGLGWGLFFPIVKDLWSSTFVLLASGVTLLLFAIAYWASEVKGWNGIVSRFFTVFGVNAIAAYALHEFIAFWVEAVPFKAAYGIFDKFLPSGIAALVPVFLFCLIVWYAMNWLYQKKIFIKI